ncbi:ATP-binding cassette domain-containing protein [Nakamurella lactea]|uniref:ATP-binding cassette domain-containing protein n=1 Tax=Nakamurella lactea TaxID=459515 RepID=UPI00040D5622|nr:ATP-binding cassette domain-containing protein [Nakamurella lactea]
MSAEHGRHEVADKQPETPTTDESPVADGSPVTHGSPVAHETRVADETPVADESPVVGAEAPAPGPALVARGLSLRGSRGQVFADVALTVAVGETVLLVGPAGTGRSCLLLALTGRMAGATGELTVAGHSMAAEPRKVRARTSVARISEMIVPEPNLTVAESIVERGLLDDVKGDAVRQRFDAAADILGLPADRGVLVDELSAADRTALALALAFIGPADVVVLDDVDRDVDAQGLQQLCTRMVELGGDGTAIVATALQPPADPTGLTIIPLTPANGSDS